MQTRRIVRSEQWWDHKVPVLLAAAAIAIGDRPGPAPAGAIGSLALLVVSIVGIAAFGHVLNDWCDVEADAEAGKANRLAALAPGRRGGLVVGSLLVGLVPWIWLERRPVALALLGVEVLLLVLYSAPPVRLKARGLLGALADAAYSYAVPLVLVAAALGPRHRPDGALLLAVLGGWGLVVGLRGIAWHQLDDLEADRAAGTRTFVHRLGARRTERLVAGPGLAVELGLLVALVLLVGRWWVAALLAVFAVWRTFQVRFLWLKPVELSGLGEPRRRVQIVGYEYVNAFVEQWLPLGSVVAVAWTSPWWWTVAAVVVVLFPNALRSFLVWDIWVLPDGLARLAHVGRARRSAAAVAAQRRAAAAAGPVPVDPNRPRRWVFVVCGPPLHLDTLDTAIRNLRPLTAAEIWVVTDAARNTRPIEGTGIDHVVDVRTPADLDDHQASIWLKTSVHRHLPVGEWCYLDSDIICIAPGAEEVFDHRAGPVAFASDITIRENSVDRFSPWAMTCPCLGYDTEHSCGHLREQLRERFGLDVPGDWLHWNGGVFVFGPEGADFLDLWHERAVASFGWPEWRTRDQGALIATAWSTGQQDLPRLPADFNFIADLGNFDLCLDPKRGWAHHPAGPWFRPRLMHLYTSALEDPGWDLGRDVEVVVLRRSGVRMSRYLRSRTKAAVKHGVGAAAGRTRWFIQFRIERLLMKLRRFPRRLTPARLRRSILRRLGRDVADLPIGPDQPGPQRADGPT